MDAADREQSYRILVVDDEPSIREALALGLASETFTVDTAADGCSAVSLACEGGYDVLIVDLSLPDIDGIEVIRRVQMNHPEVVCIAITSLSTKRGAIHAFRTGARDYIEKPFHLGMIKSSIRYELNKREILHKALLTQSRRS
jgi:two-component system, OmpR family, response regulator